MTIKRTNGGKTINQSLSDIEIDLQPVAEVASTAVDVEPFISGALFPSLRVRFESVYARPRRLMSNMTEAA